VLFLLSDFSLANPSKFTLLKEESETMPPTDEMVNLLKSAFEAVITELGEL